MRPRNWLFGQPRKSVRCFSVLALSLSLTLTGSRLALSQDDADDSKDRPAAAKFAKVFSEWKTLLKDMKATQIKYLDARSDDAAAEIAKTWDQQMAAAEKKIAEVRENALAAFKESPNENTEITKLLLTMLNDDYAVDRYESAYPIAVALAKDEGRANTDLLSMAAAISFCMNDYDSTEQYIKRIHASGGQLTGDIAKYAPAISTYRKLWKEEQEARQRDADSNLPRVLLKTNRGEIELELFENEAPGAVGNFIHLVEEGFYDGLTFHRVLEHFMAQGGCPKGDGSGGPGYEIYCECYQPNHRKHFRGSLSMAHAGRDTGGSQFFLNFVPTDFLNGKHTVFGRVVKGIDVLSKIKRREPSAKVPADRIIEAKVIRKDKDKNYQPNRVK